MVTGRNNDWQLNTADLNSRKAICTLQNLENGKYSDSGDYPCNIFSEKNTDNVTWVELFEDLKCDRLIVNRNLFTIENRMNNILKVQKDDLESSLLKFQDMGVTIEQGIRMPVRSSLRPEDIYFVNQWIGIWTRNICENYQHLKKAKSIKKLKQICKDIPAVIVGAGPSLDKNIDELKDIQAIIIATDRAYKPLLNKGIKPDFVVSVDCHDDLVLSYLDKVDSSQHTLILNTASDYNISRKWKGDILYFNMGHKGMQFCDKILPFILPDMMVVINVGCVINTSIIIADWIGCKNIILAGCDFSYPQEKMVCDTYDWIDGKFQKIEVDNKKIFEKRTGKIKKNGIYTYPPFLDYEDTMLKLAKAQNLNIINSTEGGIIDSFPMITLKESKEKYCINDIETFRRRLKQEVKI